MAKSILLVILSCFVFGFGATAKSLYNSSISQVYCTQNNFAPPPDSSDIGVTQIIKPIAFDTILPGSPYNIVTIRIQNFGNVTVDSFVVSHQIFPNPIYSESVISQILPGDSLDYQLQNPMLIAFGYFTLCIWTELQTDTNPANDKACQDYIAGGISVKDFHQDKISVNLHPNPFSDQSTLTVNSSTNTTSQFNIYSINGQKLMDQQVKIHSGENQIEIDLENQNPGLYFYTLEIEGQVFSGKLFLI